MRAHALTISLALFLLPGAASAQTYTQMQWGMDKTVTPYAFGANINGTWRNLGTVSSAGVWNITASKLMTNQTGPSSGSTNSSYNFNHINIPSDNYNIADGYIGSALMIDYIFGGANTKGARDGLTNFLVSIGSDPTDNSAFYTGVFSTVLAYNKAGPNGANITGYISNVVAKPGSTLWNVIGFESNTFIETGGTSKIRNGINLVSRGNAYGTDFDAAVVIGAATHSGPAAEVAWKNGIYFTDQDNGYPIEPTGCLICTDGQVHTVAKGVDISSYTITGNAWKSPYAYISGTGTLGGKELAIGTPIGSTSLVKIFSGVSGDFNLFEVGKDGVDNFIIRDVINNKNALVISPSTGVATLGETGVGGAIVGTTSGGNATAGNVGEVLSLEVPSGTATTLTTGAAVNVGNSGLSLTAGDWDCNGNVSFLPTGTTSTGAIYGWISTTSATNPGAPNKGGFSAIELGTPAVGYSPGTLSVGPFRVNVSTTTTVYLGAMSNFSVTLNSKAYGYMACRRVR